MGDLRIITSIELLKILKGVYDVEGSEHHFVYNDNKITLNARTFTGDVIFSENLPQV